MVPFLQIALDPGIMELGVRKDWNALSFNSLSLYVHVCVLMNVHRCSCVLACMCVGACTHVCMCVCRCMCTCVHM